MAELHPLVAALLTGLRDSPLAYLAEEAELLIEEDEQRLDGRLRYGVYDKEGMTPDRAILQLRRLESVVLGRVKGEAQAREAIIGLAPELGLTEVVLVNEDAPDERLTDPEAITAIGLFVERFTDLVRLAEREILGRGADR